MSVAVVGRYENGSALPARAPSWSRRYRYEYERADHVALLELLRGLRCRVMLSGYPSDLYDAYFPDCESMAATTTIASPPPSAPFRRSPGG